MATQRFALCIVIANAVLWTSANAANVTSASNNTIIIHKDDPNVYCTETQWYNVLFFYASNYAIHAATVLSLPGESAWASAAYKACCLLVPYAGVRRGLNVFMRASALAKTPLQMAARANALCMVVRSQDWTPTDGDVIEGCDIKPENLEEDCKTPAEAPGSEKNTRVEVRSIPEASIFANEESGIQIQDNSTGSTNVNAEQKILLEVRAPYAHYAPKTILGQIGSFMLQSYRFRAMPLHHQLVYLDDIQLHGLCQLPPGYTLCFVPPHMSVRPRRNSNGEQTSSLTISSQFSALQVLWSITQTGIGSYTLYKSRGSQLDIYGYAAFGLTVIPYVIASIINLLASLVSRQYDDVFLVHSKIMDEAVARGGWVDGVVGTVDRMDSDDESVCEDDELGKVGNTSVVFKINGNEDGKFKCTATSADGSFNYNLEPAVSVDLSTLTKTKKFLRNINNIFLSPAEAEKKLAKKQKKEKKLAKKQKKEKKDPSRHILTIPSHGPFTRLPSTHSEPLFLFLATALLIAAVAAPYIIIYILTGWQRRQATSSQSNFTIHWLTLGQTSGLTIAEFERHTGRGYWGWILLFVVVCYSWSPIGGLIVVAQEMYEIGNCSSL